MTMTSTRFGSIGAVFAACCFVALPSVLAQEGEGNVGRPPRELFLFTEAPPGATPHRQAKSAVAAFPNLDIVWNAMAGDRILLNVTPDTTFTMFVTKVEVHGEESKSVFGRMVGFPGSSVILVVLDDALASEITAPPAGIHYKTKYAAEGIHFVCEMNDDWYAPCGGGRDSNQAVGLDEDWVPEADEGLDIPPTGGDPNLGTCANVEDVFDNMIVYTNVARAAAGGTSAIQAECQLAIDRANEAYDNSPISARIRLIRRYEITYDEVGTYDDHLDRLSGTNGMGGSAPWTTTRSNRDTYNADFCTLWVDDSAYCGLAWCNAANDTRAYEVVTWDCAAGNLSHPHEIGHNQGCDHDPDNAGSGCAAYSYSYGHRFFGTDGVQYRTVMAYSPGTRIPYFSNPSQTYQGTATGTSSRDNETTIDNTSQRSEDYQTTRWDIWVDFAYGGFIEIGTFDFPYNTLAEGITNLDDYVSGASEYPNLYIKEGTTTYHNTISKPMKIIPCGGPVTIQ
jgi:hypothetical protein